MSTIKKIKRALVFGVVISSVSVVTYTFFMILLKGSVLIYEPNLYVLYSEITLMLCGMTILFEYLIFTSKHGISSKHDYENKRIF